MSKVLVGVLIALTAVMMTAGCGGSGKKDGNTSPTNVGGGFTLVVSGGTLNDGSGVKGLSVLATLRDSSGTGPGGAAGWEITIAGPGINPPLVVRYDDGSPASYMTWWWEHFDPLSGVYTATAANGATTLTYNFSIDASKNLSQPALNQTANTISWNAIPGTGSYYYRVTDGSGYELLSGYHGVDPLLSLATYSFSLPVLTDGSYLVEVLAQTTNRKALQDDPNPTASPALAAQENISIASRDIVIGGTGSGYSLAARGGVLYEGRAYSAQTGTTDYYGLAIWTSILTTATPSTAPASDWDITVTGPGITAPVTFTYPRTNSHYVYWDFGAVPAAGTYTISATVSGGTTSLNQTFTIPSPTSKLPIATGLAATPMSGGRASVNWNSVVGANSYYVNIWAEVGGIYTEIAGSWVTSTSATVANGTLTKGVVYDFYITACELDMSDMNSVPLPVSPGPQVDMSDTTFTYVTVTAI